MSLTTRKMPRSTIRERLIASRMMWNRRLGSRIASICRGILSRRLNCTRNCRRSMIMMKLSIIWVILGGLMEANCYYMKNEV